MTETTLPTTHVSFARSGASTTSDEYGMREMQARAYKRRGEKFLLIKSPPASGKSRALMFIALDKLHNQGVKKALIIVPERSIGGSFGNTALSDYGFFTDFTVTPRWNLCDAPESSTIKLVGEFLESPDQILICTHATFRFAFEKYGVEAFDDCLIAIDEFHHVSMSDDNVLGRHLADLIARDKTHVVAMTGSYFRGDAVPVLSPGDEEKFRTVVYTYYEQLNGYEHLKSLSLGYFFYTGNYLTDLSEVLDSTRKTILHIPNVNARESTKQKIKEVEAIMDMLGTWKHKDPETGFHIIKTEDGRTLRVADLVEDERDREKVMVSLKDPRANSDKGWVDIIIALGMAKEGFDWIWCEHALTVGYRSSLTEIVQIIGRATRDAPGKTHASFTNLIAKPDTSDEAVTDAINDTLKAIAASLLMEQVLIPNMKQTFRSSNQESGPLEGFDYGPGGYETGKTNVGLSKDGAEIHVETIGLKEPTTEEGRRVCDEDIRELVAAVLQDKPTVEHGLFNENAIPEETTVMRTMNIVKQRYPNLPEEDQEAARQRVVAKMNILEIAKRGQAALGGDETELKANTALVEGIRKFATDVRALDVDLIDSINPFQSAFSILSKNMDEKTLRQLQGIISAKKVQIPYDEARTLAKRALEFQTERGRAPSITSNDNWERKMAEGVAAFARHVAKNTT